MPFIRGSQSKKTRRCHICQKKPPIFSQYIGICSECIRNNPAKAIQYIENVHSHSRSNWGLRTNFPHESEGVQCKICSNTCYIAPGESGYCGLWENRGGRIGSISGNKEAILHTYLDPLPTNCCSTYFCPGGTGKGYPIFACSPGPEFNHYNLACFLYGCNFFCYGCQNSQHRNIDIGERYTIGKFISKAKNPLVSCICWFGGSPEPQLPWTLRASKQAVKEYSDRILRVCWEWNGAGHPKLVRNAVALALDTGGNAKFDLKYYSPILSQILSGVSNEQSFKNFEMCFHKFYYQRKEIPVLTATTLLIPGYIDETEIDLIAGFLAELDETIPYSLLAFHPSSFLSDLPVTSPKQAEKCYNAAKGHLKNVHIGNRHLLGWSS